MSLARKHSGMFVFLPTGRRTRVLKHLLAICRFFLVFLPQIPRELIPCPIAHVRYRPHNLGSARLNPSAVRGDKETLLDVRVPKLSGDAFDPFPLSVEDFNWTVQSQSAEIPSLSADELTTLRQRLTTLRDQWDALNPGETLELSIDLLTPALF